MKLWAGRFSKEIDKKTNDFNSSISFDSRMYKEDILGSCAHAAMLPLLRVNLLKDWAVQVKDFIQQEAEMTRLQLI